MSNTDPNATLLVDDLMLQRSKNKTASESISIVVPVYNSESSLPALVERLQQVLPALTPDFELIFVNDGSKDRMESTGPVGFVPLEHTTCSQLWSIRVPEP